jgi:hypothetical protein
MHMDKRDRCPRCQSQSTHRSRRQGVLERLFCAVFFVIPFRCEVCDKRYFRPRRQMANLPGGATRPPPAQPESHRDWVLARECWFQKGVLLPSEETSGYAKIIVDYACDTVGGQRLDGQDPHRQRMRWRIPNPRGRKVADVGSNLFHYPRAELSRPHAARARVSVCDAETYRSGALTDQLKHRSKTLPAHHSQRARQSVS